MITARVIPCLDVQDGRVVKGVRFAGLRDAGCPEELAKRYEAEGADELVLLDISATAEGRSTHRQTISAVRRALSIPLTTGGGVRSVEDARSLLSAGADKVSINTAAVQSPELIRSIAKTFGSQCTILALDAAMRPEVTADSPEPSWEVVTHSGRTRTNIDVVTWAIMAAEYGAGEILLTSWDRDGTRSGYDLPLLTAVSRAVRIPVIASGGANTHQHMIEALNAGADAVLAASIFHESAYSIQTLKQKLAEAGILVRL